MSSKSILKCVALVGIIFPAVYLCTHFLMYNTSEDISIDVYQTFITGSLYTRLCGPERRPYNEPSRTYEVPRATSLQTNGHIFIRIQEGLNDITNSICDFVVDAGLPDVILHIPEITSTTSSKKNQYQSPLAPALYVIGDSLNDCGNNNFLQTQVKVNYEPYGIDFPFGVTGRFTNGKTFVDFIAESLGLPSPPPYMGLSTKDKIKMKTGVNYASGSAGILTESGIALGENMCFEMQIKYFQETVTTDLLKIFKTRTKVLKYLSKSILMVSIGSNDYINNYLQPAVYSSSQIYTSQQFANNLQDRLVQGLKKLYTLGARKFLVFNIGKIGCVPTIVNSVTPKLSTPCVDDVNDMVLLYNNNLPNILRELESALIGSTFVHGDAYNTKQVSSESGQNPCCAVGVDGLCLPGQTPCQDRNAHQYWDGFHPTEVVNHQLASDCFNGSFSCVPINVLQLLQKH